MTRSVLLAGVLAACGLLLSAGAWGGIPSPITSDFPSFISVVGRNGDLSPDGRGAFAVIVRDIGNIPIAGVEVVVDLCDCFDMEIDEVQSSRFPPMGVDCANRRVWATTNVEGVAGFCIVGSAENTGGDPGPGRNCGKIIAGGVVLGPTTPNETDENGHAPLGAAPGVEILDLVAWLRDFGTGVYFGRSDFDQNGAITVLDIAHWLRVYGDGNSRLGPIRFCVPVNCQ